MAYVTKDTTGLVQLWNNRPRYNNIWFSWIDKTKHKNEIGIDVTDNKSFNHLFDNKELPCCLNIKPTIMLDNIN